MYLDEIGYLHLISVKINVHNIVFIVYKCIVLYVLYKDV